MASRSSSPIARACQVLAVLLAGASVVHAQTSPSSTKPKAAPTVSKPVGTKAPAARTTPANTASKPPARKPVARKPAEPSVAQAPAEAVVHLPLTAAQQAIATSVHIGKIPCELGQTVELVPMEGMQGFFKLHVGKLTYTLAPEETTTGAVRLEDRANGIVWLQLINKSMLMNQKQGRRMADECMSPPQLLVAQEMRRNPPPSLLDAPPPRPAGGGADATPMLPGQTVAKP